MGADKPTLRYHGMPELERMRELLETGCTSVYIGCREDQLEILTEHQRPISDLPPFAGHGPIGSLLSAWTVFPDVDWLVTGCDYPYFDRHALGQLLEADPSRAWSGFYNQENDSPEPLLGIYRQAMRAELFRAFHAGEHSLRRILQSLQVVAAPPADPRWIRSVDTRDAYLQTMQDLQR